MANQKTTMSEESKNVKEARELLSHLSEWPNSIPDIKHALFADAVERERDSPFFGCTSHVADLYGRAPELLSALCNEVEELKGRNATQEESIETFQSQFRVMKEAIEGAMKVLQMEFPGSIKRKAAIETLRSAISPKRSEQKP